MRLWKLLVPATLAVTVLSFAVRGADEETDFEVPERGCSFKADPDVFLSGQARAVRAVDERVRKISAARLASHDRAATPLHRRNFIDDEIFDTLSRAKVTPAPLSSDEEFFRRITLDLTGRIPTPAEVRAFVADAAADKRDAIIDKLLVSPEFSDKWAVWLSDLVQNSEGLSTNARRPQLEGRNNLHAYFRNSINNARPIKEIVYETITGKGNNYFIENGQATFAVLASTAMGPVQDTYDMMLVRSASAYMGMAQYDCILCHNGRGHLDQISVWGTRTARSQAQNMAAFFSRMRLNNGAPPNSRQYEHPLFNSTDVQDAATGQYDLNTNFGNRPARCLNNQPVNPANGRCVANGTVMPEYRDGFKPSASANWRAAFADKLVADPMFARNFANRFWKEMFGMGLVDPVDSLDPDRLDPNNPPAEPWKLQATHPALLEKLAKEFMASNTDLRTFLKILVHSTAYQLSSRYEGEWKLDYVPLFARHYPRRLWAEEVHDAIVRATGSTQRYTWATINNQTVAQGTALPQSEPVSWAMQLPGVNEPTNNGNVSAFLNFFLRGNRDTAFRSQSGSIQQQLALMNDQFVTNRNKVAASPILRDIARLTDNNQAVEELFLTFLSRKPSLKEQESAVQFLAKATTTAARNTAVEDLAWACINKVDFLFSY